MRTGGRQIKFVRRNMTNVNLEEHSETKHISEAVPLNYWKFIVHRIWFYKNLALVSGRRALLCSPTPVFGALTPSYRSREKRMPHSALSRFLHLNELGKYLCLV